MIQHFESYYGGISCHEVQANLKMYASGLLPSKMSHKMVAHLRECSFCRSQLHEVNQQQPEEVGRTPLYDYTILASVSSIP